MADRVAFNSDELDVLWGLPWLPQLIYMRAIRPNMDYVTGIVGIRTSRTKRISYQAIREQVEVHEKQGRNGSDQPSMSALRHAVSTLINVGLIARVSGHGDRSACLVFRCLLADVDSSVRNKYDRGTTGSATEVQQEVRQEVQQGAGTEKFSTDAGSQPQDTKSTASPTTGQSGEVRQANPEKCDIPPDPDLKTHTTPARVRDSGLLPVDFRIDDQVRVTLLSSGVPIEVAEYFLEEFKCECASTGKSSFNWAAALVVYCKKWRWRYDKERGNNNASSGGADQQRGQSRASKVHEREKRLYEEAIAREQSAEDLHSPEGSVRSQVVVPYRRPRDS